MVRPPANSYALATLAAHEKLSDVRGGSLVCSDEHTSLQPECPSVSFIYRYTSSRMEVRDFFDADTIYATLLSTTLPSEQRLKVRLTIEHALHGTMGDAVYIIIIARNTDTMLHQLFLFDPWNQICSLINTTCCIRDRVTAAHLSKVVHRENIDKEYGTNNGQQLLVLGTEVGSVIIFSIKLQDILAFRSLDFITKKSRSQSVSSIKVCIPANATSAPGTNAYIFVGGFNGEVEALTFGKIQDDYGVIDSKMVTTLWENMPVVKIALYTLANDEELVILAGQAEREYLGQEDARSTSRAPSMTILKLKLPSLKSMEVAKKELTSKATEAAIMLPYNSTNIISLGLYGSDNDDALNLSSLWSYQPPNRVGRIMYASWKVSKNVDQVEFIQQHAVKTASRLLDACMSGTLGTVVILGTSGLDIAYTARFQSIKSDVQEYYYDYDAVARKMMSILSPNISNEKSKAYGEKRRLLGSALIIDQLLMASGHDDHYPPPKQVVEHLTHNLESQFESAGRCTCDALSYFVLDTLGEEKFCKLSENIPLNLDTRQLIQEYWSVDHLQIQDLQSMRRMKGATTFPNNYIWAIKQQFGVSAAVDFSIIHHIPVEDISDWEVAYAFLERTPSSDAALCLSKSRIQPQSHLDSPNFLPKLISRWFKEIETNKPMVSKFLCVPLNHKLEKEVLIYCGTTNPSPHNLNFLFSYYLNRYRYVEAMMVHEKLSQYEDEANVAMKQRNVIVDSTSKLVPSIQLKLALMDTNKPIQTEYQPFSSSVFAFRSSDHFEFNSLLQRLIHQTKALNPTTSEFNPFSRPPNMAKA